MAFPGEMLCSDSFFKIRIIGLLFYVEKLKYRQCKKIYKNFS